MIGGDGYSVGVNEVIGGRPSFPRYSSNYAPVFNGELLQNGASKNCGCSNKKNKTNNNASIYSLIKQYSLNNNQNGGSKGNNIDKQTQFEAIKEVSTSLSNLSTSSIKKLITKLFFKNISDNEQLNKNKQLGGFTNQFANILAPLGKNNLLVIATLLLLHYYAVEQKKEKQNKTSKTIKKGGNSFISSLNKILAPTGINSLGAVVILALLEEAFVSSKRKSSNSKKQSGGNPLKNLIAPLGTNAFIATGLLIVLKKLFVDKVKYMKTDDSIKKKKIGGNINSQLEKVFNMVAPISFNVFTSTTKYNDIVSKISNMSK